MVTTEPGAASAGRKQHGIVTCNGRCGKRSRRKAVEWPDWVRLGRPRVAILQYKQGGWHGVAVSSRVGGGGGYWLPCELAWVHRAKEGIKDVERLRSLAATRDETGPCTYTSLQAHRRMQGEGGMNDWGCATYGLAGHITDRKSNCSSTPSKSLGRTWPTFRQHCKRHGS